MMPAQWVRQDGRNPTGAAGRARPARGGGIEERFKQFDRNGDGKLTPDEVPNAQLFKRMDKNGDGVVTWQEAQEAFSASRRGDRSSPREPEKE
jgi:Ca2+-binding EF-hand superfamily protein